MGALGARRAPTAPGSRGGGGGASRSACGRGRAGACSRRGVDGGGDDVAQSSGWARRRRSGGAVGWAGGSGPGEAAALWAAGRRVSEGQARGGGVQSGPRRSPAGAGDGEARGGGLPGLRGAAGRGRGSPGSPRGAVAGCRALSPGRSTTTLPRRPRLRRTRRRRRGRGRPRGMEERKEEGEAEIQEHGPEHWFSKWERQCLAEAEQDEQLPPELQEEAAAAAQPEHKQQKLWHLFQNSATAVAQLYKDRVCQQPGLSLWVPFQNAATAVTNLYKESVDTHQRSFDIGIQIGYQRRNKDVLAWVKKRRRTIRREDLISFLCGKVPPPRNSRAPPRLTVVSPNRATSAETSSSVETDLQPFREAIALHGLSGAMASISVRSSTPGSPTHVSSGSNASRRRNGLHDVDLNTFISEEMALHLDNGGTRKRTSAQCGDVITDSPTHKRNRMI
ncbi:PREDICTED: UPF0472 protein C16orf72 homolog [Chinchilla lanigera]|nr:PREDICTED: UPF0472 protein C16orf72 homolog [Chinchilla lanigera]